MASFSTESSMILLPNLVTQNARQTVSTFQDCLLNVGAVEQEKPFLLSTTIT